VDSEFWRRKAGEGVGQLARQVIRSAGEKIHLLQDRAYWRSIRHRYCGNRGFVIGNGPSLKITDLDQLVGEITIASNKIYLAFKETQWRPDYFTVADDLVWEKVAGELEGRVDYVLIPDNFERTDTKVKTRKWKKLGLVGPDPENQFQFSDDFCRGVFGGCTVTYQNLQLAVHLGLDPIYLIGCDHYYQEPQTDKPLSRIRAEESNNHFISGYRQPGEVVNAAPIGMMTLAYQHAHAWSRASGVRILNATRGGHLEIFPRVEFDSLFG
jgi:hypothetical protein